MLTLAIDRAIAKNAIYSGLYLWIAQALDQADNSDEVRVVILRGAGDDFTAGNDMQDFLESMQQPDATPAAEQPPFVLLKSAAKFSPSRRLISFTPASAADTASRAREINSSSVMDSIAT